MADRNNVHMSTAGVTLVSRDETARKDTAADETGDHSAAQVSPEENCFSAETTVSGWPGRADGTISFPEVDDPAFHIPGLSDKANLAVCISGGGFRATTLALGWLRALQHMGLLSRVKYLNVISGASWLGAALCFQKKTNVTEFLGRYLEPENCTLDALKAVGEQGRSYAKAVADARPFNTYLGVTFVETVNKLVQFFNTDRPECGCPSEGEQTETARQWTQAMTAAFLEPFDLGEMNKSTVTCSGTKADVKVADRAEAAGRTVVHSSSVEQLPFLVIGQALMLPRTEAKYFPFEWTPLYAGCPVAYNDISPKLGSGWVETLGLNAKLSKKAAGAADAASVKLEVRPTGPASLGEAIGISSAYTSYTLTLDNEGIAAWAHKVLGFHTADYFDFQDFDNSHLHLTDGGACDLFGIYPALRRKVPNIMVLIASGKKMEDAESFAKYMRELPALFGEAPADADDQRGAPPALYNEHHKVFKTDGYGELFQALHAKMSAGEAAVHVETYDVLENKHMGIKGGWKARIMWVVNEQQEKWEARLPSETKEKLDHDRTSAAVKKKEDFWKFNALTFNQFPHIDTAALDYTPELVNMMANHAAWMLVSNEALVREMFGKD